MTLRGRKILVTGHTGFKGSWLSMMLQEQGAEVSGFALPPPTSPALFDIAQVEAELVHHIIGDVRDANALFAALEVVQPEIIFHLAAQPLVRASYAEPIDTFAVNIMGTANLLEATRQCESVRSVVNVTTDKCYQNNEWPWAYRENEALGGRDPYSASKACSEIVTSAYRESFLAHAGVAIASARAGNVIGGGDWAEDRLLPDFYRALQAGQSLEIRSPDAIRPWQHVLEPLSGYIALAGAALSAPNDFAKAWNFGPYDVDAQPVRWILDQLCHRHEGAKWHLSKGEHVHEAHYLKLDSSLAIGALNWSPKWSLAQALEKTASWHEALNKGADMRAFSRAQIAEHKSC
ncbi:CDP-glucose 4,6-dehydratase [Parasphingorhabdus halotolerans]|uniref:CDP-glucose 4,6-dehydratase n=1 Tax=Parasphingorhabdus halotolerans TaxID=2725558 RepID=A0A6H2DKM0_9SPHN|nr:CDP-glucose 4,6-dehydratase [Parasphingorhabdus halotolerans]QJB68533.1 CDP-glucose 4,6-dehydratase [Parasphingorhabdus halotolerans]